MSQRVERLGVFPLNGLPINHKTMLLGVVAHIFNQVGRTIHHVYDVAFVDEKRSLSYHAKLGYEHVLIVRSLVADDNHDS